MFCVYSISGYDQITDWYIWAAHIVNSLDYHSWNHCWAKGLPGSGLTVWVSWMLNRCSKVALLLLWAQVSDTYITASSAYSVNGLKPYNVAEGSWSHEVRQFGHLEDVDRTFGLQLVSQRQEGAEGSCCDSAHTGGRNTKKKKILIFTVKHPRVILTWKLVGLEEDLLIVDHGRPVLGGGLLFNQVEQFEGAADGTVWVRPAGGAVVLHLQNKVVLMKRERGHHQSDNKSRRTNAFVLYAVRTSGQYVSRHRHRYHKPWTDSVKCNI